MNTLPEKRERSRKYWRTPKAVMRSLGRSFELKERFATEQILEWLNAAAPMAASTLINQAASDRCVIIREDPESDRTVAEQLKAAVNAGFLKLSQIDEVGGTLAQKAASDILDRVIGKPRPQADGSGLQRQDSGRKIEIIITDPQGPVLNEVLDHENVTS